MPDTFDWPYHTPQDEYPGGTTTKLGGGYRFAAKPTGPDEVICHLNFPSMFVYQLNPLDQPNYTVEPQLNVFALEKFYRDQLMYKPFYYRHHRRGLIFARFNKPMIVPKTMKAEPGKVGGRNVGGVLYRVHQVEPFDMELLLEAGS